MILSFRIPGLPIPKMRHRTANGRAYNPQIESEEFVRRSIKEQLPANFELIYGPIVFSLNAFFPRPVSHYGTGKNIDKIKNSSPKYHVVKPDYSNLTKFYEDCMNKLVYFDDSQIVGYERGAKYWIDKTAFAYTILRIKIV